MKPWTQTEKLCRAVGAAFLIAACATTSWGATNTAGEAKCQETLTKAVGKQAAAVAKAMSSCTNSVLDGDIAGPCPDTKAQTAIDKASAKALKAAKKCQSTCSISGVECIGTPSCPPFGLSNETCDEVGKNPFESTSMGFPGPYCPALLGHPMDSPADFGECAAGMGDLSANEMMSNVYGDDLAGPLSSDAMKCLKSLAKSLPKSAGKMASVVAKCRTTQLTAAAPAILAANCPTADAKTADAIAKTTQKFVDSIAKKCPTDAIIQELSLCGQGVGGVATVAAAQACLEVVLEESSYSVSDPETRSFVPASIINGAYPGTASARCGDNLANQLPNQFYVLGEECDGDDDSECPGECLPPGDAFACTCGDRPRVRTYADAFAADLDNGWSGASHNSKVTERAGFILDVENCNCTTFDPLQPATCDGVTSDQVCDVSAELQPRCSQRVGDGTTCDQVGDNNGANADSDCRACDQYATNAGDYCVGTARYCIGSGNTGDACNVTADCPGGTCSGSGTCLDGPFAGDGCTSSAQCGVCVGGGDNGLACANIPGACPGGACEAHSCSTKSCVGGVDDNTACAVDGDCASGICAVRSDCGAQCYTEEGVATTACSEQADCAAGERCRGICDGTNYCLKLRNGAPLPLSSEGTSVCVDSQFFTNAVGTKDIVTGEHATNYDLRSVTHLANEINSRPCPVCGGFCAADAGGLANFRCNGTCTAGPLACRFGPNKDMPCANNTDCEDNLCTEVACRFDDDCAAGTCTGVDSPECQGNTCRLDLACAGGPNSGKACRIEANTAFGTTSVDCPPLAGSNVSGTGLAISWTPLTSAVVTLEQPGACNAPGYENYDCNCVLGGGSTFNQPNRCDPACDDPNPAYYGAECPANTVCTGGSEAGAACDEDSDCSGGGLCNGNPRRCGVGNAGNCSVKRCVGGAEAGAVCASNQQCPGGTCPSIPCISGGAPCADGFCRTPSCTVDANCDVAVTCDDVCPSGRCTPLCLASGLCTGGDRDGDRCAIDEDCTGGGTCGAGAPDEGACAQGAFNHCDGPGWGFVSCSPVNVGTQGGCEAGTDSIVGNENDFIGAGYCRADVSNCFFNDGYAEGGSTLNGKGNPTEGFTVATFCIPASSNPAVNATAGLPGPGRIRQPFLSVPNFTTLP